ncbi:hypothetical protein [Nitrosomonas cryotolerans]|uniref:hypothetical protein n=1 Tax=Nitrosomonas cryotolerans TaxID=44575 RepID=UPI001C435C14|nr:hypothetical protein [Nitrosomonas cryotolerans]
MTSTSPPRHGLLVFQLVAEFTSALIENQLIEAALLLTLRPGDSIELAVQPCARSEC